MATALATAKATCGRERDLDLGVADKRRVV
jgi:hypothetical protein